MIFIVSGQLYVGNFIVLWTISSFMDEFLVLLTISCPMDDFNVLLVVIVNFILVMFVVWTTFYN
jgi:hypothetical protein